MILSENTQNLLRGLEEGGLAPRDPGVFSGAGACSGKWRTGKSQGWKGRMTAFGRSLCAPRRICNFSYKQCMAF